MVIKSFQRFFPLFSNKSYSTNFRIILLENGKVLSEESKVTDAYNEFLSNVVKELKIEKDDNLLTDIIEESGSVLKAIKKIQKSSKHIVNKKFF